MLHVMTRWFALETADAGFLDSAPHVFRYEKHYDATPQQVWESLQSDESLAAWGKTVGSLTWTSAATFRGGHHPGSGNGPVDGA